jgi:hypothetical protein
MSFSEILELAQAQALSDRLHPTEISVYEKFCREYSKLFSTPLHEVLDMSMEHVLKNLFSDSLAQWSTEDDLDQFLDLVGSLQDPEYDAKKEKQRREEMRNIEEQEALRIKENRPIHESLVPKQPKAEVPKQLPKSGGINMEALRHIQNEESEGGKF